MSSYNILNTAGVNVATIGVSTTTGATFPIELIGLGISQYGPIVARNQYRHLENFAEDTPPPNPVTGMFWYRRDIQVPHFYNGSEFVPLSTARNGASVGFDMLPAAIGIDFTTTGNTTIFQAPGTGERFHPTSIVLVPNGTVSVTSPAAFSLFVSGPEDVLETVIVDNPAENVSYNFTIAGATRIIEGAETLNLEVTTAAAGGNLNLDAYVFGYTTV